MSASFPKMRQRRGHETVAGYPTVPANPEMERSTSDPSGPSRREESGSNVSVSSESGRPEDAGLAWSELDGLTLDSLTAAGSAEEVSAPISLTSCGIGYTSALQNSRILRVRY